MIGVIQLKKQYGIKSNGLTPNVWLQNIAFEFHGINGPPRVAVSSIILDKFSGFNLNSLYCHCIGNYILIRGYVY